MRRRLITVIFCSAAASASAPTFAEEPPLVVPLFSQSAPGAPTAPWQFVGLAHQTKPETRFRIVDHDGERVLEVSAVKSYGNLASFGHASLSNNTTLSWRWKLEQPNLLADLHEKDGDDSPAKVCVLFEYDTGHLPFTERAKLALARSSYGGVVPAATLCYVWDHKLAVGSMLPNAFTNRIRFIVLESGESRLHQWVSESRRVADDFWKTFGSEFRAVAPDDMPPIVGVAVGADSDNTGDSTTAYLGDVRLEH